MKIKSILRFLLSCLLIATLSLSLFSCLVQIPGLNGGGNDGEGFGDGSGDSSSGGNEGNQNNNDGNNQNPQTPDNPQPPENPDTPTEPQEPTVDYHTVKVLDSDGKGMGGVIVKLFDQSGKRVIMSSTDRDGVVKFDGKNSDGTYKAPLGSYTVELTPSSNKIDIIYDEGKAILTPELKVLEISVFTRNTVKDYDIAGELIEDNGKAYSVKEGDFYAVIKKGATTYFVFTPTKDGIYEISVSSKGNVTLGNYGNPMNVLSYDISNVEELNFELEIPPSSNGSYTLTTIGVTSENATECLLSITRVSDVPDRPEYAEWHTITAENAPATPFALLLGEALIPIDVTDANFKAVLADDGYYYTEDGKRIVMKITQGTKLNGEHLMDSFKIMAGLDESAEVAGTFGGYIYDQEGNFLHKEDYTELIEAYIVACDEANGVCYVTEELARAIQVVGDQRGWWDSEAPQYMFGLTFVQLEQPWLFACYIVE